MGRGGQDSGGVSGKTSLERLSAEKNLNPGPPKKQEKFPNLSIEGREGKAGGKEGHQGSNKLAGP